MSALLRPWLAGVLALWLAACGNAEEMALSGVIEGKVMYRERMLLPPGAAVVDDA